MASENETVAEVSAHYRAVWQGCEDVSLSEYEGKDVLELVDRFEAAHGREVAELKKKCEEYERQRGMITDLRAKLKIAEDELNYVMTVASIEEAWSNTSNALAAIREEGGTK